MHDLDRAMFETEQFGQETHETEQSENHEFLELLGELTAGTDGGAARQSVQTTQSLGRVVGETELAAELLEVQSAAELNNFLGQLLTRAAGGARDFARSDTGRALGGILKAAGEALPVIGRGVGTAVGPQYADIGERLGKGAGALFGLELEGLSGEDREFEVAKAFVRFANAAAAQAAQAPASAPPAAVATAAATTAARRHAPGLLAGLTPRVTGPRRRAGRWERRGDQIVIFDV